MQVVILFSFALLPGSHNPSCAAGTQARDEDIFRLRECQRVYGRLVVDKAAVVDGGDSLVRSIEYICFSPFLQFINLFAVTYCYGFPLTIKVIHLTVTDNIHS